MSDGLGQYDWMLSAKERPWHGIGTVVQEAPTSADAIKIAKLDWTVIQEPIYSKGGIEIPNQFVNIRHCGDTDIPLGIVKGRYQIVQNSEAFDFVDNIVQGKDIECRYETAGSLFNGKKIFLLVRLPDSKLVGDNVENYLFFTNGHDGTSSLTAGITNVRVVCNNTLQLAIKGSKRMWKCRHTSSINDKKLQAQESLGLAVRYMEDVQNVAWKMAEKKVNEEKFLKMLSQRLDEMRYNQYAKEQTMDRIITIYTEKDDLQNFRGTAWGLYNATSDFISNTEPMRRTSLYEENKLNKFFNGNDLLENIQELLISA